VRDEVLRTFVKALFDTESFGEKLGRCIETILEQSPDKYPLSARRIAAELGEPVSLIAEAFCRVASKRENFTACEDAEKEDWVLDIK
jgi:hypothetical protein